MKATGEEASDGGGYLLTGVCLDFEQVDFEALFHLTRLLLGCSFLSTQIRDLSGRHMNHKAVSTLTRIVSAVCRFGDPPT